MMKKVIGIVIGIALVPLVRLSVFGADNATVDVVMSIQALGVEAIKVHYPVSASTGTSKIVNGRSVFKNTGNVNEDFSIRIASTTGSWTPFTGSSAVPANQYRLRVIWAAHFADTSSLTTADFDTNDILGTSSQLSSDTVFFKDASDPTRVGIPSVTGGSKVPVFGVGDNERHLFFRFDAGADGTTGSATAFVNVSATATP